MRKRPPKIFYGWWIVLTAGIGLFFGYPPIFVYSFSVFFKSLAGTFHASRTSISLVFAAANLMSSVGSPIAGRLADLWGTRKVIVYATSVFGLLLISMLFFSSSLWRVYAIFLCAGLIGGGGSAPVPYGKVITEWFDKKRGLALGLTMIGVGLGAILMPSIAQRLILAFGWRAGYAILGCVVLIVPTSAVALVLKDSPQEIGLLADGEISEQFRAETSIAQDGLTPRSALNSYKFWLMASALFLVGISVHGCVIHLVPLLTDRGISPTTAAFASSVLGFAILFSRVGSGYLLDRLFAPIVAGCFFAAAALGMWLFWAGASGKVVFLAALLVGLGMGAEVDVIAYLTGRYFGLRSFGEIYGYLFAIYTLSGALGPILMAEGFDRYGSYRVPLLFFSTAVVIAVVLITRLGSYQYSPALMANYGVKAATVSLPTH